MQYLPEQAKKWLGEHKVAYEDRHIIDQASFG